MSEHLKRTPEKKETVEDNARKFKLDSLSSDFLEKQGASSMRLTIDWLEISEDAEVKLARREFPDKIEFLRIAKVTKDGSRKATKEKISAKEYEKLIQTSLSHLEKVRHEFPYSQDGHATFRLKYDEFIDSDLRLLEVDALNEKERATFNPQAFPRPLTEVTGNPQYSGHNIVTVV